MNQKEENLFHMETLLRKAMESHPDTQLIIFPELAVTGYQCGKNFKDLAETATINSTSVKKMSALAKEFHVHIVYGMAEKERLFPEEKPGACASKSVPSVRPDSYQAGDGKAGTKWEKHLYFFSSTYCRKGKA